MIEWTFLKESVLIKQVRQMSVVFVIIDINKRFKFEPYVCNVCHNVLMMSINLTNIAILNNCAIKYRCKSEFVNSLRNADSTEKRGVI